MVSVSDPRKREQKKNGTETELEGAPVCGNCGSVKIWEAFEESQDGSGINHDPKNGEWICPHCQGEIHFLDDED